MKILRHSREKENNSCLSRATVSLDNRLAHGDLYLVKDRHALAPHYHCRDRGFSIFPCYDAKQSFTSSRVSDSTSVESFETER